MCTDLIGRSKYFVVVLITCITTHPCECLHVLTCVCVCGVYDVCMYVPQTPWSAALTEHSLTSR